MKFRTGGSVLPKYNTAGQIGSGVVSKYLPGLVNYFKGLPLYKVNPFATKTLGPDWAVGTANSALNFFRDGTNRGNPPSSITSYNDRSGWGVDDPITLGNRDIKYYEDAEKYIQENSPMYKRFVTADETDVLFQGIKNADANKLNTYFPLAISQAPWNNQDVLRSRNLNLSYPQSPADYRFKTFDNWKGWVDMKPEEVVKMMNTAQSNLPINITGDAYSTTQLGNILSRNYLNNAKNVMSSELLNFNDRERLVSNLLKRDGMDLKSLYGTIMENPMYRELTGREGPIEGITNEGLDKGALDQFLRSQMLEGISPNSTIAFDNNAALDNMRYIEALKSKDNPAGMIRDEQGKPVLDPEEIKRLLFGNMSGRSKQGPFGNLQDDYYPVNNRFKPNNLWTNLNRDGGAVSPEIYDYVYGGIDNTTANAFKDTTDPYFAPGGAFNKPKIDPALGKESPSEEIQEYRKTEYPTAKGVVGQVKDHMKTLFAPVTQGNLKSTLQEIYNPTDFYWLSQKGDKDSAYGYLGVPGKANTIVRPYKEGKSPYYDETVGYNVDDQGNRIVGASTSLSYKDKPFRKPRLTVTDSPVNSQGVYTGFLNMNEGTPIKKIALGGEDLSKYVMAGEVELNFFQEDPAANVVENISEPEVDLNDCTDEELRTEGSECYKKAIDMGLDINKYIVNRASSANLNAYKATGDFLANKTIDIFDTGVQNAKNKAANFMSSAYTDMVSDSVQTAIDQGTSAITGETAKTETKMMEPIQQTAGAKTYNPYMRNISSRGGQYREGGVYDLTPAEIGAIMAAGGSIEIIE